MIFFANINNFYFKDTFSIGNEKKFPLPEKKHGRHPNCALEPRSASKKGCF